MVPSLLIHLCPLSASVSPQNVSTLGSNAVLNMSGLAEFSAIVSDFRVGDFTSTANGTTTTATLAKTSTITANRIIVTSGRGSGSVMTLRLGSTANFLNADNIWIGGNPNSGISTERAAGTMNFATGTGTLQIRGKDGIAAGNLFVGALTGGTSTPARTNTVSLNGHSVDLLLNQLSGWITNRW